MYRQVGHRARVLASRLRHTLPPQSVIGICSVNRLTLSALAFHSLTSRLRNEWIVTDFACAINNFIPIGIHTTYDNAQLVGVLKISSPSMIFCSTDMVERLLAATEQCPSIKHVVCFDDDFTTGNASTGMLTRSYNTLLTRFFRGAVQSNGI